MPPTYDVIVSGAGPAGSTCAIFLGKKGRRVLVLEKEKFPRDKICADNKTWKCTDIVKELGLWKQFQKLPKAEIHGVLVASPAGNEMYTPLHESDIREKGYWFNVRRKVFDNMLAQAAKKEKTVIFKENCNVISPIWKKDQVVGVKYEDKRGKIHEAYAKVVVGADGSTSPIAHAVGHTPQVKGRYATNIRAYFENVQGPMDQCQLYYLKGICPGYFWIFPVDQKTCNVGIGMRPEDFKKMGKSLHQILDETLKSERFAWRFKKAKQVSEWKEWGLSVLGKRRTCAGNGWVLCGDAGTFAMTFSGEGCGPSMRTGKIAAEAIDRCLTKGDVTHEGLKLYEENLWKILDPEVKGFRWLEFLLLNEPIYNWVIKKASKNKELLEISSRMQDKYELSQKMVSPQTILKLLFS
jgi:geranylgeranyl reductase family protein